MRGPVLVPTLPPPRLGYWRLLALALAAAALCGGGHARPARGQEAGPPVPAAVPREARTAQWYARHHEERFAVVDWCNDRPGPARRSDECAAAWQGNILAAEEEARRNLGDTSLPTQPEYWRRRPVERREVLARCKGMTPEEQARWWCAAARRG